MPSHAPARLVSLVAQPVVAEHLGVEVVRLVRRVVDMELGSCSAGFGQGPLIRAPPSGTSGERSGESHTLVEEEDVMVDLLRAPVQPEEHGLIHAVGVVDDLRRPFNTGPSAAM